MSIFNHHTFESHCFFKCTFKFFLPIKSMINLYMWNGYLPICFSCVYVWYKTHLYRLWNIKHGLENFSQMWRKVETPPWLQWNMQGLFFIYIYIYEYILYYNGHHIFVCVCLYSLTLIYFSFIFFLRFVF